MAIGIAVSWRNIWRSFNINRMIDVIFSQKIRARCFDNSIIVGNARWLFDFHGILSSTTRFLQCSIWSDVCGYFIGCHCYCLEIWQKKWSIWKAGQNEFHFETFIRTHHSALFDQFGNGDLCWSRQCDFNWTASKSWKLPWNWASSYHFKGIFHWCSILLQFIRFDNTIIHNWIVDVGKEKISVCG